LWLSRELVIKLGGEMKFFPAEQEGNRLELILPC